VAVNIGDEKQVIADYWKQQEFTFDAVRQDADEVSAAFGVKVYPTNFVIDGDGKIVYGAVGWNEDAIRKALADTQ